MRSIASQGNIERNEIYMIQHHAEQIKRIWKESSGRYGVRKVWQKLRHEGYVIARCTVARLMQQLGIQGVWRGKNKQTTRSRDDQKSADDLVKRNFKLIILITCGWPTSRIFKPIQAGSIPHLLLMCSHEQLLDGKYQHG
jgi:transposase InsO family protein